eukprot:scaffold112215_cov28-Tisochrysis_lutea.AAC.1
MQRLFLATVAATASAYQLRVSAGMRSVRSLTKLSGGARSSPFMDITFEEKGEFGTTDYTMTFFKDGKPISPWHDIPLEAGEGLYNMLTEIPKMTLKKME